MEPNLPSSMDEIIIELSNNDKPLINSRLTELSNLNSEELELFKGSWTAIEPKRRRHIVYRLVELAEDNFSLNFDSIFKYCIKDEDDEVRSKAIEGLWENEEPSIINPLIDLVVQDSSEKVQAAASTALGKFVLLAEHRKLRSDYLSKILEVLLHAINDKNQPIEVRSRALEAVAPLSLPQVKTVIIDAYQSHDFRLKVSSIYAMGKNCDAAWLSILLDELASADTEIRYEAACACGELEEEEAVPCLIRLLNDPDIDVQMAVIQALGKIGGAKAKECLESCLNNSSEPIRQAAEQALNEMEVKETLYLSDFESFDS